MLDERFACVCDEMEWMWMSVGVWAVDTNC